MWVCKHLWMFLWKKYSLVCLPYKTDCRRWESNMVQMSGHRDVCGDVWEHVNHYSRGIATPSSKSFISAFSLFVSQTMTNALNAYTNTPPPKRRPMRTPHIITVSSSMRDKVFQIKRLSSACRMMDMQTTPIRGTLILCFRYADMSDKIDQWFL